VFLAGTKLGPGVLLVDVVSAKNAALLGWRVVVMKADPDNQSVRLKHSGTKFGPG